VTSLTLTSTAQSQDSLKDISIARWKVMQLYDIAVQAVSCDSLQRYQEIEIQRSIRLEKKADSIIAIQDQIIQNSDSIQAVDKRLINTQEAKTELVEKEVRKWKWAAGGAALIILLQALALILG